MKKHLPILAAMLHFTCAAGAADKQQELVLLQTVPAMDDASPGLLVSLQEPWEEGCRFVGQLARVSGQDENLANRALSLTLNNSDRWIIRIERKSCSGKAEPVAMTVQLRRVWTDEYAIGQRVMAEGR